MREPIVFLETNALLVAEVDLGFSLRGLRVQTFWEPFLTLSITGLFVWPGPIQIAHHTWDASQDTILVSGKHCPGQ